jgi:hypothetical protein
MKIGRSNYEIDKTNKIGNSRILGKLGFCALSTENLLNKNNVLLSGKSIFGLINQS